MPGYSNLSFSQTFWWKFCAIPHTQNKIITISVTVHIKWAVSNRHSTASSHLLCIPISVAPIQLYCATRLKNFHTVHFVHCKWFGNPYRTNKCTVLLLCISLQISSYKFQLTSILLKTAAIKVCYCVYTDQYTHRSMQSRSTLQTNQT
jgi:hypothetical protein